MKIKTHKINAQGMAEMKKFLDDNYKSGPGRLSGDRLLRAAVRVGEYGANRSGRVHIEIHEIDSVSGRVVTLDLSTAGVDVEVIDDGIDE